MAKWRGELLQAVLPSCATTSAANIDLDRADAPIIISGLVSGDALTDAMLRLDNASVQLSESPLPWAPVKWANDSLVRPAERTLSFDAAVERLRRRAARHAYLRFVPLDSLAGLTASLPLERALALAGPRLQAANVLLGDGSMGSALHFGSDDRDNLLAQLRGRKEVLLVPPRALPSLGFSPREERRFVVDEHGVFIGSDATGRLPVENHSPLGCFAPPEESAAAEAAAAESAAKAEDDARMLRAVREHGLMCSLPQGSALFIPALWSHAVASVPEDPDSELSRGLNAAVNLWFLRGMASFDRAVEASPVMPQAHMCRASALQALDRHAEAARAFEAAASLRAPRPYYAAEHHAGLAMLAAGEAPERAWRTLQGAAAMRPTDAGAQREYASALAQVGTRSALGGDYKAASRAFTAALAITPSSFDLYRQLARSLDDGKRPKRALAALEAAGRLRPLDRETAAELKAARLRRAVRRAGGWSRDVERAHRDEL